MAITALPVLNRTSPTFRAELDDFFTNKLPAFTVEANDTALAMDLNVTTGASITPLTIGLGAQALIADANKGWAVGMTIKVASAASPANWMVGDVTAYNVSTGGLTVDCQLTNGGGTFAAWVISFAAMASFAQTQAPDDSSDKVATTAYVDNRKIGEIIMLPGATAPPGYLPCTNAQVLINKNTTPAYLPLFNVVGYAFGGSGDDFGVPYLEAGDTWAQAYGATIGADLVGSIREHSHTASGGNHTHPMQWLAAPTTGGSNKAVTPDDGSSTTTGDGAGGVTVNSTGGLRNKPSGRAVNFYVKYK
jgi:microcystin-dependent protein